MSFTFEMNTGKGVLSIDIYNFIRAKQKSIGGAVLIYIAVQPCSHECTWASNTFNRESTGQMLIFSYKDLVTFETRILTKSGRAPQGIV